MHRILPSLLFLLSFFPFANQQAAATIVRLDIRIGSQAAQAVYIELLDQDAPVTVANFLNYIENGTGERRYDNTFVHRLATGFVIQLGGYTFDPALGSFEDTGVSHIQEDAPVVNEFSPNRSNIRGTLAMAKLGNDPDSATSEWFFNLADNSANLDNQNGGFTVFGRVLGAGMDTVDAIARLNIQNATFPALPVVDYTPGNAITLANLVKLERVLTAPPAAISADNLNPDFGPVELDTGPDTQVINIQNIGVTDLVIGSIGDTEAMSAPFSLTIDNCSNQTLGSLQSCSITTGFTPTVAGDVQDLLNIPSNDSNLPELIITLSGTGISQPPLSEPDIQVASPIALGNGFVGQAAESGFGITNPGDAPLTVASIEVTGSDAPLFTLGNFCIGEIKAGTGCREGLTFTPVLATDSVDATLRITSNDPDTPVLDIPIEATAGGDRDGIADAIENGALNAGDGNSDGILDSVQSYVTSLPDINGDYITLETAVGQSLLGMTAIVNPSPDDTPTINQSGSLSFGQGFFEFTIEDVPTGGPATVTLYLPKNSPVNTYFKYGITPGNPFFDHWYEFKFDGDTGAEFLGDRIVLHFIDGGRGDSDLIANGRIVDPGGPAVISVAGSSSGGGGGCALKTFDNQRRATAFPAGFIALICGLLLIRLCRRPGKRSTPRNSALSTKAQGEPICWLESEKLTLLRQPIAGQILAAILCI